MAGEPGKPGRHRSRWRRRKPKRRPDIDDACRACDVCGDLGDCGGCGGDFSLLVLILPLLRLVARTPPVPRAPQGRRAVTHPARLGVAAIRGYQRRIGPHLPIRCRHTPSCSEYGVQAVRRYGLLSGGRLTAERIARCTADVRHGTPDPVP